MVPSPFCWDKSRCPAAFRLKGADLICCWVQKNQCSGAFLKTIVSLVANNWRKPTSLVAYCYSEQQIGHVSQKCKDSGNEMATMDFDKLLHIPGNLEVCRHTQGCSYIQERLERALFSFLASREDNKWPSTKYKLGPWPATWFIGPGAKWKCRTPCLKSKKNFKMAPTQH